MISVLEDVLELSKKFKTQSMVPEIIELYNAVLDTPKGDVIEVGSASGGTTIALIKAAEQVGKNVISIDPYPESLEEVASHYVKGITSQLKNEFKQNILTGEYKNIIQYNETTKDCIDKLPKKISMVFIDGLHELSYALSEFGLLFPLVVPAGRIYMHDTKGGDWSTGQLSGKPEEGLTHLWDILDKDAFSEIKAVGSLFCGRKK